jgi:hypothetical protein
MVGGDLASCGVREARPPVKTQMTLVMADNVGAIHVVTLSKVLLFQLSCPLSGCSKGNSRSGSHKLDNGGGRRHFPAWGHIFGEVAVGVRRLCEVTSIA